MADTETLYQSCGVKKKKKSDFVTWNKLMDEDVLLVPLSWPPVAMKLKNNNNNAL